MFDLKSVFCLLPSLFASLIELNARDKSDEATEKRNIFRKQPGCFRSLFGKKKKLVHQMSCVAVKTLKG